MVSLACSPIERSPAPTSGAATATAQDYNPPAGPYVPPTTEAVHAAQPAPAPSRGTAVPWPSGLGHKSWDDASRDARTEHRPILLVVYANWCPHCHELAPMFNDPEVARLAQHMEVVLQDADQASASLTQAVGTFGAYVPRVFFLRSDGTVRQEITSSNPRFPYFYTPGDLSALRAAMHRALET